jgi:hypothetical protein
MGITPAATGGADRVKKRPRRADAPQDFDAAGPNGSATATEDVSMESPQPPEAEPTPPTAETKPAPEPAPVHTDPAGKIYRRDRPDTDPALSLPEEPSFAPSAPEPSAAPSLTIATETRDSLEERVRRLEAAVKELQETRVTDRPVKEPMPSLPTPPLNLVVPSIAAPPAPPPAPPPPPPPRAPEKKRTWLLTEMWAEARAIQYMFFDPRYRMSWGGRVIPLVLLALFLTTGFWLPGTGIEGVGRVLQKAAELVLGFALFKSLNHEARRYRETAPDLPPGWRL